MKWYDCKEKLPPTHHRVMVCREIRVDFLDHPVLTHDIGMLTGTEPSDRWKLDSQQYCALPCTPTVSSGIISHWGFLPQLPARKEK